MYHPFGQIFFGMRLPLLLQRQKAEAYWHVTDTPVSECRGSFWGKAATTSIGRRGGRVRLMMGPIDLTEQVSLRLEPVSKDRSYCSRTYIVPIR
jgi:hypothetical protein